MKNILLLLLSISPVLVSAQTSKYNKLQSTDPLIGTWKWLKDPIVPPFSPATGVDFYYLRFTPGDSLSVGAESNDPDKGMLGTGYFQCMSNGTVVYGVLSGCTNAANNGKSFRFKYEIEGDILTIFTTDGEAVYKRM